MEIDIHQAQRQKKRKFLTQSSGKGGQPARQIAQSQQIKKLVIQAGESKVFDATVAASNIPLITAVTSPNAVGGLFIPVLGTGSLNRIGKSVTLLRIRFRARFQIPAQALTAGGLPDCTIRMIMVRDKEPLMAGTNPTMADVITVGATAAEGITKFQNVDNFGRFQVLMDKVITLQDPNLATTGNNARAVYVKKTINFKSPIKVRFNDTLSLPQTDQFFLFAGASSITATPNWVITTRCIYKDE